MIRSALKCAIVCCIINLVIAQTIIQPEISSLRKPEEEFKDSLRKYPSTLLARNLTPEQIEDVRSRVVGLSPSKWPQVLSWFQPPKVKKCSFQVSKTINGECKMIDNTHGCWGDGHFDSDHGACSSL